MIFVRNVRDAVSCLCTLIMVHLVHVRQHPDWNSWRMNVEDDKRGTETSAEAAPIKREVVELAKTVVLFLVLFLLVRTFIIEGYPVHGDSMAPTLDQGDRILVFKLPLILRQLPLLSAWEPIKPGEIVVFESPVEANRRYVKRVIAVGPRERHGNVVSADRRDGTPDPNAVSVRFDNGSVYINHRRVDEPYLREEERHDSGLHEASIGAGEYYVMGDHRSVSKDSRRFGPIAEGRIVGEAVLRFWPPSKFGLL